MSPLRQYQNFRKENGTAVFAESITSEEVNV